MKNKAYSSEMLMALPGDREKPSSLEGDVNDADREWESQLAVDTYAKQTSLEGDVNGAARRSRVGELVGRGHICKTKLTRGRC